MKFCSNKSYLDSALKLLSNKVFKIESEEIGKFYTNAITDYDNNGDKIKFLESLPIEKLKFETPTGSIRHGIDLPVFYDNPPAKLRIMLIGVDPFREKENPSLTFKNKALIGTPFAVHNHFSRENQNRRYWNLIKTLLENSNLYITDIYKLFYIHKNIVSSDIPKFTKALLHYEIIDKEIEYFKPDIIIGLGRKVGNFFLNSNKKKKDLNNFSNNKIQYWNILKDNNKILNFYLFPHLSKASGSAPKNFIETNGEKYKGRDFCGEPYWKILLKTIKKDPQISY